MQKPTFTAPVPAVFPKDLFFRLFVTDTTGLAQRPRHGRHPPHREHRTDGQRRRGPDQQGDELDGRRCTGAASSDLDSDAVTCAVDAGRPDDATSRWRPVTRPRSRCRTRPAVSPTFVAPHFAASTTLKFQLVVTDVPFAPASAPAFTTVQINANRAPAVGHADVVAGTQTVGGTRSRSRSRPRRTTPTVTRSPASPTSGCRPTARGDTRVHLRAPSANVTLDAGAGTPRSATFTAPAFTVPSATLVLPPDGQRRLRRNGAVDQPDGGARPTRRRRFPRRADLRTGHRRSVRQPAEPLHRLAGDDRRHASTDPDGAGPLTYAWSGQPCGGLGESLGCLFATISGYPGGSCRGITITPDPVDPGQGDVHRTGVRAEQPDRVWPPRRRHRRGRAAARPRTGRTA